MAEYWNILVIASGALGDLIASTVAIRAVRTAYPKARITAFSNSLMHEVCPPGTLVDEIISSGQGGLSVFEYLNAARLLRGRRFDLAINLRWSSEGSAFLARLSGAKTRVGSGPKQSRWLYTIQAPLYEKRRHEFLRHLDIIRALGVSTSEPEPFLYISEENRQFAGAFFGSIKQNPEHCMIIHPGASTLSKAWPSENYLALAKRFIDRFHAQVIVTWGPGEDRLAKSVVEGAGEGAILSPPTRIGELGAVLQRGTLCVCNYSGIMNVAMAVRSPLVALGCTSPEDWGPYGDLHRTVNSYEGQDSYTDEQRLAAMKSITFEDVWKVVETRWRERTVQGSVVNA